jgi:hypothetical protein
MTDSSTSASTWPEVLGPGDDLYSVENLETGVIEYLVFASMEFRRTFIRDNGRWWPAGPNFVKDFDDPKYSIDFVEPDYIAKYDEMERLEVLDKIKQVPPSQQKESSTVKNATAELAADYVGI